MTDPRGLVMRVGGSEALSQPRSGIRGRAFTRDVPLGT